jgi:hypothetical protein
MFKGMNGEGRRKIKNRDLDNTSKINKMKRLKR